MIHARKVPGPGPNPDPSNCDTGKPADSGLADDVTEADGSVAAACPERLETTRRTGDGLLSLHSVAKRDNVAFPDSGSSCWLHSHRSSKAVLSPQSSPNCTVDTSQVPD